jgi:hypothetical protein
MIHLLIHLLTTGADCYDAKTTYYETCRDVSEMRDAYVIAFLSLVEGSEEGNPELHHFVVWGCASLHRQLRFGGARFAISLRRFGYAVPRFTPLREPARRRTAAASARCCDGNKARFGPPWFGDRSGRRKEPLLLRSHDTPHCGSGTGEFVYGWAPGAPLRSEAAVYSLCEAL